MKTGFSTYDLVCNITELQRLVGMRVNQVYDIDNKTYLIRLQRSEEKCVLLIESGSRIHTTAFEWPKNMAPSGFSMKMRKHLKNKRLEVLRQLGMDRIVDMQFGTGEVAYHVILELYDRGNIILTDRELTILNVLRPHTEGDKIRFAVREKYPVDRAHERIPPPTEERLKEIFNSAKSGEPLKKILNVHLEYGPAVLDHVLLKVGFQKNIKLGKGFDISQVNKIVEALQEAERLLDLALSKPSKGYIIQKREKRPQTEDSTESEDLLTNQEFHPMLFLQNEGQPYKEFPSFDTAVDEYFSSLESQKIDVKALQQEREAMKKLENVRRDHKERLVALEKTQNVDKQKAELITRNQELVDNCLLMIQLALANQLPWPNISEMVNEATERGDPVASAIKELKLNTNQITLLLSDPYANEDDSVDEEDEDSDVLKPMSVDVDLALSAFANAKKYYDLKRSAAKKQQKTIESQGKALKSAEKKTKQTLKEVKAITSINKARKVYWFEKFFWFISSENYLVIGGRDQQQNELVVKRYLKAPDIYVHADIQGASSVVIKNPSGQPVTPKTLNEAGIMAVCYSVAWEAKVVTSAWWVHADQVSKTAPTGEYLTTGSFMIRGKKNYLPPCHLIMGFSFLFKLEDSSVARHKDERRHRVLEEGEESVDNSVTESKEKDEPKDDDIEIVLSDDDGQDKEADMIEEEDEEQQSQVQFPDTEIRIEHTADNKVNITKAVGALNLDASTSDEDDSNSQEEKVIYLGDDIPVVIKPPSLPNRSKPPTNKNKQKKVKEEKEESQKQQQQQQQQPQQKRGKKGKLKKIKEKYKDQDDEERELRMAVLQSAGNSKSKETKKGKKGGAGGNTKENDVNKKKPTKSVPKTVAAPPPLSVANRGDADSGDEADEQDADGGVLADVNMLDSLTGQPLPEDELLFAVPVVAPYNALVNYKYKVKLTPGTGKRGKAARTAVNVFLKERTASQREKDLLRSVKDQDLSRNLPGKVKLSAPQLQKLKK